MKRCLCCGAIAPDDQPVCLACGEGSWELAAATTVADAPESAPDIDLEGDDPERLDLRWMGLTE